MRRHLVLCSLFAACAADASSSLVRISDEPAGANCADGGVAIASGVDADDNGVLDDDEVTSTSYVCDGPSGDGAVTTLVETAAEPAGDNCAAGGTVVTIGPDTDGDGTLDADEVTSTVYVCDGVHDEWQATIAAPAVGAYDTAFRFSGDRGRTWTYCGRNAGAGSDGAEDGYQAANAGSLTVN